MSASILKQWPAFALFALFGLVVPLLNAQGFIADTTLNLWGRYFCFAIVALGVDLVWGYTGILSLCQAFFFCLGGYAMGMHMLLKTGTQGVYGSALPDFMVWNRVEELPLFWEPFHSLPATLLLGVLVPGFAALVFGFFAFRSRIKGVYFAIITQALALAVWLVFLRNETMLGGTNGLTDFKTLLAFDLSEPATKRGLYVLSCAVLLAAYLTSRFIVDSKLGKLLLAIRDGEHRLRFIGYRIVHFKLFIFVVAAALAGVGGMLYVPQTGIITPGRMDVQASIEIVVWTAVGGRATLVGAIVGAFLVNLLYSYLTGAFPGTWLYFLGALFIGVVLYFPDGIAGIVGQLRQRIVGAK
jgi:urea transport system permease protein